MRKTLLETIADPATLTGFHAALAEVHAATDAGEMIVLLGKLSRTLGCSSAVFSTFVRGADELESFQFLAACSPKWCQYYVQRRWFAVDQFLNYARAHSEPIMADQVRATSEGQREMVARGQELGFRSAAIAPFHSGLGSARMGVLYIGSERENYFDAQGFTAAKMFLREIAHVVGEWWIRRMRQNLMSGVALAETDTKLLDLVYQGYASKDIATISGLNVANVNQRLARVATRLGVPSRRVAASLAHDCGLF